MSFPPVARTDWLCAPEGLMLIPGGSVTTPEGYRAGAVACGLKESGALDVGVLASTRPTTSGLVDTANALPAAPVHRNRGLERGNLRAVVANAGNANAATGDQGLRDAIEMGDRAAAGLGLDPAHVVTSSTGVIGRLFSMETLRAGIDGALAAMSDGGGSDFAKAICTTDRFAKAGAFAIEIAGRVVHFGVASKGAGMINPRMATMLCYVTTDASVAVGDLQEATATAAAQSFNRISVDGQMSPSDTLAVMANGEGPDLAGADLARFSETLKTICRWSAIQMVKDGEGAEHAVRIDVRGGADPVEADRVARAIGASPLVKAAIFGRDPNWGRIEQAVGQALIGAPGEVHEPLLAFDGLAVDAPCIEQVLALPEYDLRVDLGRGGGEAEIFASDLTHAYVSINADYTT